MKIQAGQIFLLAAALAAQVAYAGGSLPLGIPFQNRWGQTLQNQWGQNQWGQTPFRINGDRPLGIDGDKSLLVRFV